MNEYDRLKAQKEEILQRQREALERPLLAEIDALKLLLRRSLRLPRPWMDGGVTWEEWEGVFSDIERAIGAAVYPIPLNEKQQFLIKQWAADDRLWTTQETVEINLATFARSILASRLCR